MTAIRLLAGALTSLLLGGCAADGAPGHACAGTAASGTCRTCTTIAEYPGVGFCEPG